MVTEWLARFMFAEGPDPHEAAEVVANALSDYGQFMSHGRRLGVSRLKALGLNISDLEADPQLQDLVLSVHHAVNHTMNHTGVVKIVENHLGKAFIRRVGMVPVPVVAESIEQPPPGPDVPRGGNRQQRRAAERQQKKRS